MFSTSLGSSSLVRGRPPGWGSPNCYCRGAGQRSWGLVAGARADALVVDVADPALRGVAARKMLDALVFSSPTLPWKDVIVAGRWSIRAGRHKSAAAIARRYAKAIAALSGSATARPS